MDHFAILFLFNKVCYKPNLPWVYGAAVGGKGTIYVIDYKGPCLRCLMHKTPETAESCAINGLIPPFIMQVASYQTTEVMCYLSGKGFSKILITVEPFNIKKQSIDISHLQNLDCFVCCNGDYEYLDAAQPKWIEAVAVILMYFVLNPNILKMYYFSLAMF